MEGKDTEGITTVLALKLSQIKISSRPDSHCQMEGKDTEGITTVLALKLSQIKISSRPDGRCQMEETVTQRYHSIGT
jgi:uncharacterized protein YqgV (UPF0045/DUF77 family)